MKDSAKKLFTENTLLMFCWLMVIIRVLISLLHFFIPVYLLNVVENYTSFFVILYFVIFYFFNKPKLKIEPDFVLLVIIFVFLCISCAVMTFTTGENYFVLNSNPMNNTEYVLLIYMLGRYYGEHEIPKTIKYVLHILLLAWTAFMLYILISIFINHQITTLNGGIISFINDYGLKMNANRNYTGQYSEVAFLLCVGVLYWTDKTILKAIYIPACIINYIVLIMSESRTAIIAVMISFSFIIGVTLFTKLKSNNKVARLCVAIPSGIVSGFVFYLLKYPIHLIYSFISKHFGVVEHTARAFTESNFVTLNDRTVRWREAIEIMLTRRFMLSGVTPYGIFEEIAKMNGNEEKNLNAHNAFLEVGACTGIPGFVAYTIWFILILICCWRIYFIKKEKLSSLIVPMIIMAFSLSSLAESWYIFYTNIISYVFFFLCGYVYEKGKLNLLLLPKKKINNSSILS